MVTVINLTHFADICRCTRSESDHFSLVLCHLSLN